MAVKIGDDNAFRERTACWSSCCRASGRGPTEGVAVEAARGSERGYVDGKEGECSEIEVDWFDVDSL